MLHVSRIVLFLLTLSYIFSLTTKITYTVLYATILGILFFYKRNEDIREAWLSTWHEEKYFLLLSILVGLSFSVSLLYYREAANHFNMLKQFIQYIIFPIFFIPFWGQLCQHAERIIKRTMAISFVGLTSILLYQSIFLHINRPTAWFASPASNWMAGMLCMFSFWFLVHDTGEQEKDRLLSILTVLCIGIALTILKSRGAFLGFSVAFLVMVGYAIYGKVKQYSPVFSLMKTSMLILGIIIGLVLPTASDSMIGRLAQVTQSAQNISIQTDNAQVINTKQEHNADSERIYLWQSAILMIHDHWAIGVGFDNFNYAYTHGYMNANAKDPKLESPYNVILHIWSETGVLGLIMYMVFWCYTIYYVVFPLRQHNPIAIVLLLGIIVSWVHGMVDYGLLQRSISQLMSLYLGLLILHQIALQKGNKSAWKQTH